MPRGTYDTLPVVMPMVDWRKYKNLALFDNDGTDCVLPAYDTPGNGPGSGLFPNIIEALTGRYVGGYSTSYISSPYYEDAYSSVVFFLWYTFAGVLTPPWGALSINDVKVGIDANDKVYIELPAPFTVEAGLGSDQWGFVTDVAASLVGSIYRATATADWVRGDFLLYNARFYVDAGANGRRLVLADALNKWALDVPSALRNKVQLNVANPDLPTATYALYSLAGATDDSSSTVSQSISWGINDKGYVFYISNQDDPLAWYTTALAKEFKMLLGFTGETVTPLLGSNYKHTASSPCAWSLFFSRPFDSIDPTVIPLGSGVRLANGQTASISYGTAYGWSMTGWLDGPSDTYDRHMHLIRRVGPLMGPGKMVSVSQDWGDSRRGRRIEEGGAYNVDATVEMNGYRGLIIGAITEDRGPYSVSWPQNIRQRSPFSLSIYQTAF